MTDYSTVVFFTLMALQVLPGLYSHVYVHHVLWNRMTPKVWCNTMRESNEDKEVQNSFYSVLWSIAVFACSLLAYAIYHTDSKTFPILVAVIFSLMYCTKFYVLQNKKNTAVSGAIIAVLTLLLIKSNYSQSFVFQYINECAIILAYTELFIASVVMNKTYIKTFKSVSQCQ